MSDRRRRLSVLLAGLALLALLPTAPAAAREPDAAELRASAKSGDAEAMNNLGGMLVQSGDQSKLSEAREWFRRAAGKGHVEAMNNYASMLRLGLGGPVDEAEAKRLTEQAAAKGSMGANLTLADRYLDGTQGYARDPARALAHVRAAAESGARQATYAQWRLAMMVLKGTGTAADPAEAYRLMVRASEAGGVNAMISRAVMLATGEGVAEDDAAAREWYRRASESGEVGFAHGLRALGAMMVVGEGGPVDLPRGIAYLRIAKAGGDELAGKLLDTWSDRVTDEVHRKAVEISNAWMARHMPSD